DEVDVDVLAEGKARRLRLVVGGGTWEMGEGAPVELEGTEALLALYPGEERAEVDSFELRALGGELRVEGSVEELCGARAALRSALDLDLGPVAERFLPEVENVGGSLRLGADWNGPLGDLRATAVLEAEELTIEDMEPGEISARLELAGGGLAIEELVWPVEE